MTSELNSPREDGEAKVKKKAFKKAPGNFKRHHRCEPFERQEGNVGQEEKRNFGWALLKKRKRQAEIRKGGCAHDPGAASKRLINPDQRMLLICTTAVKGK